MAKKEVRFVVGVQHGERRRPPADAALTAISRGLGYAASFAVGIMVLLIVYDTIMRYVFNRPTIYGTEISGYLLVTIVFFGAGVTLREDRHLALLLFRDKLPRIAQLWLELVSLAIMLVAVGLITRVTFNFVLDTYLRNVTQTSVLSTPLFIPRSVIPLGYFVLELEILRRTVLGCRDLWREHSRRRAT